MKRLRCSRALLRRYLCFRWLFCPLPNIASKHTCCDVRPLLLLFKLWVIILRLLIFRSFPTHQLYHRRTSTFLEVHFPGWFLFEVVSSEVQISETLLVRKWPSAGRGRRIGFWPEWTRLTNQHGWKTSKTPTLRHSSLVTGTNRWWVHLCIFVAGDIITNVW